MNETGKHILKIKNLKVGFISSGKKLVAVDDISFNLNKGETLGIVGESGCGKSVSALSIMRLLPKPSGQYFDGKILFENQDILKLPAHELHHIRGNKISMIFQEPMTALNPVHAIGKQLAEVFELHQTDLSETKIESECVLMLEKVGIPDPRETLKKYPHQLSGGMRQRVMIAMALSCKPDILIADEPTTALDVTIQAQILQLIKELQKETNMSVIFITHDLGVIAELCDRVIVMYAGKIVEENNVIHLFNSPKHPYSEGLLHALPKIDQQPKSTLHTIQGMVPSIQDLPKGCRFINRCHKQFEKCSQEPDYIQLSEDNIVYCHLYNK